MNTPSLKSRRTPRLRLVGEKLMVPRRVAMVEACGTTCIAELVTFADMDRMTIAERPTTGFFIPGVGWLNFRRAANEEEVADINDVNTQAMEEYHAYCEAGAG